MEYCFWGQFGRIFEKYKEYPQKGITKSYRDLFELAHKSVYKEHILIQRKDNQLFYIYIYKLNCRQCIGICLKEDKLCPDYERLINSFRGILEHLALADKNGLIIKKVEVPGKGYNFIDDDFSCRSVKLDIFFEDYKNDWVEIGNIFSGAKSLPIANVAISREDIVECTFPNKNTEWISKRLEDGYYRIIINIETEEDNKQNDASLNKKNYRSAKFKRIVQLTFFVLSFLFCLYLLFDASMHYVRQISDDFAWYVKSPALSTLNNDANMVWRIDFPAIVIIYIAFIHYAFSRIYITYKQEIFLLPIMEFKGKLAKIFRIISYICFFTMPILIPLMIFYCFNTIKTSDVPTVHYNDITYDCVLCTHLLLLFIGAIFLILYIIYFIKVVIKYALYSSNINHINAKGYILKVVLVFILFISVIIFVFNLNAIFPNIKDFNVEQIFSTYKLNKLHEQNRLSYSNKGRSTAIKNTTRVSIPKSFVLLSSGILHNKEWDEKSQMYVFRDYSIDSFYISKYELTQQDYEHVMGNIKPENYTFVIESYMIDKTYDKTQEIRGNNIPVIGTYLNFVKYCNARSQLEGYDGFYKIEGDKVLFNKNGNGYRLLFELEWIYAAKSGKFNDNYRFIGGSRLKEVGWYGGNSHSRPHEVGQKKPNRIGLYDMSGNVSEMLQSTSKDGKYREVAGNDYKTWLFNEEQFGPYDILFGLSGDMTGTRLAFVPKYTFNNN